MSPAGVVFVILLACVLVGLGVHHSPWQRRKREQRALELIRQREAAERVLARQWMDAVAHDQRIPRYTGHTRTGLAHVVRVYGAYPRRGTKAVIRWYGTGEPPQDTWFELAWPRLGDWLFITGSCGYGPHSDNPETFYAFIVGAVPPGAWEAWQRQATAGQLPAVPARLG